ncbi:outer membrane beta-barrel protein [Chitinophaga vietnamensis]|uniref:outer membrane beta-barrel protein n=1 Tax=Chitinophaga vietnamensis TaxID=2593957 RepID=UPI00117806AA|nr:outer membrane beta-barrel protein [Chitinophaga vietnamensis]
MSDFFENSIRNKLNEADIPFDQEAWGKMEKMLDTSDDRKPGIFWWWLLPLLVMLGLGGWWLFNNGTSQTNNLQRKTSQKLPDTIAGVIPKSTPPSIKTSVPPSTQQLVQVKSATEKRNSSSSPKKIIPSSPQENIKREDVTGINDQTVSPSTSNVAIPSTPWHISSLYTKNRYNVNDYTKLLSSSQIPVDTAVSADAASRFPRKKPKHPRLYVGLSLGPDFNAAPSFKYGKIGFNAGILAHYYFKPKWFVTTGVVYNKKIYGATSKDYNYPVYQLQKVDANCDVLEVPVNINYNFWENKDNKVSVLAGVSSYFMLKENYDYYYAGGYTKELVFKNENRHYLAMLNVGALYQHPVGKRLILGVQPYAKIPLKGVGAGSVKLYSTGVSFQLNLTGKRHTQ